MSAVRFNDVTFNMALGAYLPSPMETIRHMVGYFNFMNETFNGQFTLEGLMKIYTFSMSEQGGRVPELADTWPDWLLATVLENDLGAKLDDATMKKAEAIE